MTQSRPHSTPVFHERVRRDFRVIGPLGRDEAPGFPSFWYCPLTPTATTSLSPKYVAFPQNPSSLPTIARLRRPENRGFALGSPAWGFPSLSEFELNAPSLYLKTPPPKSPQTRPHRIAAEGPSAGARHNGRGAHGEEARVVPRDHEEGARFVGAIGRNEELPDPEMERLGEVEADDGVFDAATTPPVRWRSG